MSNTRDVTVRWEDPNMIEKGHKVYRSTSPMDVNNMPEPIATLEKNATEFVDADQTIGDTNYYRVSAWIEGHEIFSEELVFSLNFGQQEFTTVGEHDFLVPDNVYSISVLCIGGGGGGGAGGYYEGGGGGGGGGALSYSTISVTPNEPLTIYVGAGGEGAYIGNTPNSTKQHGSNGESSLIKRNTTELLVAGGGGGGQGWGASNRPGSNVGGVGGIGTFNGGNGGYGDVRSYSEIMGGGGGGGGAGGYISNGGDGGSGRTYDYVQGGNSTSGGAGGNGCSDRSEKREGGTGGGVGLYGEISPAINTSNSLGLNGKDGSGGSGSLYGGGGGGSAAATNSSLRGGGDGSQGAVRIIWGSGRYYPDTNTVDE